MAVLFANNNSLSAITSVPSGVGGGSLNLISTQTASSSSTISFTSGIDSTYDEYVFKFIDCHAQTSTADFTMNLSVDSGSNYNVAKTTTYFLAYHFEDDSGTSLAYRTASDLAQGTGFQPVAHNQADDNDASWCGQMQLFNPSSTTFVKHFISTVQQMGDSSKEFSSQRFMAGYGNTTSAIDAVQFKMSSGNIDSGTIKLYGVS